MTDHDLIWRKSSHSADNGQCVEIGWRKSSYSAETGECVEASALDGRILVRDSKAPESGTLSLSRAAMAALVTARVQPRRSRP